jgi:hypothetical protein
VDIFSAGGDGGSGRLEQSNRGTLLELDRIGFFPMLRHYSCALAVMLVGLPTAQAADETLTLACKGTTTTGYEGAKPEPISMGIIVNFTNRTVQGFGDPSFMDYPVKITAWNDVTVTFYGREEKMGLSIRGSIDRVTGDVEATSMAYDTKTSKIISTICTR